MIYILSGPIGSGKTSYLKSINSQFDFFSNLHLFRNLISTDDFLKVKKSEFSSLYSICSNIADNRALIIRCNEFLSSFSLNIRLHETNAESGWITFKSEKEKLTRHISNISEGEKTIFILWLILEASNQSLILDTCDSLLPEEALKIWCKYLNTVSEKGKNVYISTVRPDVYLSECSNCSLIEYTLWNYKKI